MAKKRRCCLAWSWSREPEVKPPSLPGSLLVFCCCCRNWHAFSGLKQHRCYRSIGLTSNMDGLKSRGHQQDVGFPFWKLWGVLPFFSQLLGAVHIPKLAALFLRRQTQPNGLSLALPPSSRLQPFLFHCEGCLPGTPGQSPYFKVS